MIGYMYILHGNFPLFDFSFILKVNGKRLQFYFLYIFHAIQTEMIFHRCRKISMNRCENKSERAEREEEEEDKKNGVGVAWELGYII